MSKYSNCCEAQMDFEETDLCPECKEHCLPLSEYNIQGFDNRKQYLSYISEEYGMDLELVLSLAQLLGEEEDFDGLIHSIEEYDEPC